jgi:hypothetical protein
LTFEFLICTQTLFFENELMDKFSGFFEYRYFRSALVFFELGDTVSKELETAFKIFSSLPFKDVMSRPTYFAVFGVFILDALLSLG